MRTVYKRIRCMLGALLVMVLCIGLIPVQAETAGYSITLHYKFSGCEFSLYYVASYANDGSFKLSNEFSECQVDWSALKEDDNWFELAQTLDSVVVSDAIDSIVTADTDETGTVSFTGLKAGMYLMTAEVMTDTEGTYYTITPLLIAVPGAVSDGSVENDRDITITKYSTKTTTSVHVQKIWKDDDTNRPTSITVGLYADGVLTETEKLSDSNNWRYTWSNLDEDVKWTVAETEVADGYTVAYSTADDGTIVITNTAEESSEPVTEPDTTDTGEPYTGNTGDIDSTDETEGLDDTDNSEDMDSDDTEYLGEPGDVGDTDNPSGNNSSDDDSDGNSSEKTEELPQTGLDWGPAAVLVLLSLGCLLIGVVKNRMERRSE